MTLLLSLLVLSANMIKVVLLFLLVVSVVEAGSRCSGSPPKYKGLECASTTYYVDGHKGACGCGPDNGDTQLEWNKNGFVTAPNQNFFDASGSTWCGSACGKCVRLTTTGGYVDGQGSAVPEGTSKVFMVTNLCPNESPNLSWCSQEASNGYKNQYGYKAHFDLENGGGQLGSLGWSGKNPEVTYEIVSCDTGHAEDKNTPSNSMYQQCYCSHSMGFGR